MKAIHSHWAPSWLGTLLAIGLTMTAAGCGLKGDLYLEQPDADKSPAPAAASNDGGDEPGTAETAVREGMTAEAPDETFELVNTEAAMDADPAGSIMEPDEDLGDSAAEQVGSEAAMATGPGSVAIEPVTESELKGSDLETEKDTDDTTAKPDEPNAVPAETGSIVAPPDPESSDSTAPAQ